MRECGRKTGGLQGFNTLAGQITPALPAAAPQRCSGDVWQLSLAPGATDLAAREHWAPSVLALRLEFFFREQDSLGWLKHTQGRLYIVHEYQKGD
jgi:hypothetical protein